MHMNIIIYVMQHLIFPRCPISNFQVLYNQPIYIFLFNGSIYLVPTECGALRLVLGIQDNRTPMVPVLMELAELLLLLLSC